MPEQFHPHEINWTREKSARFWDYLSSKASYQENNFGKLVGETLLRFLSGQGIRLSGLMLDFGCGPGFLTGDSCSGLCSVTGSHKLSAGRKPWRKLPEKR